MIRSLPLSAVATCLLAVAPAAAQAPVIVTGVVMDSSGGVLPGAMNRRPAGAAVRRRRIDRAGRRLPARSAVGGRLPRGRAPRRLRARRDRAPRHRCAHGRLPARPRPAARHGRRHRVANRGEPRLRHGIPHGRHHGGDPGARKLLRGRGPAPRAGLQRRGHRARRQPGVALLARRRVGLQPRDHRRGARELRRRLLRLRPRLGVGDRPGRGGAGRAVRALRLGRHRLRDSDLHEAGRAGRGAPPVGLRRGRLVRNVARGPATARRRPRSSRLLARRHLSGHGRRFRGPPGRARPLRPGDGRRQRRRHPRRQRAAAHGHPLQRRPRKLRRADRLPRRATPAPATTPRT